MRKITANSITDANRENIALHFPNWLKGIDHYYVRLCLKLYLESLGLISIERIVGVGHVSVLDLYIKINLEIIPLIYFEPKTLIKGPQRQGTFMV